MEAKTVEANINQALEKFVVSIPKLKSDARNPRKHSKQNIEAIMESLKRFGQQTPIVLNYSGAYVIKGNGTLTAAKRLGWKSIAAVRFDKDKELEEKSYKVTDNKTSELGEWDYEILAKEIIVPTIDEIEWGKLGWQDYELQPLIGADWNPPEVERTSKDKFAERTEEETDAVYVSLDQKEMFDRAMATATKIETAKAGKEIKLTEGKLLSIMCEHFVKCSTITEQVEWANKTKSEERKKRTAEKKNGKAA